MSIVAAAELTLVLEQVGVPARLLEAPPGVLVDGGGHLGVAEYRKPLLPQLQGLIARPLPGDTPVLVTNGLAPSHREVLSASGWGWLDRRGQLYLPSLGLDVGIESLVGPAAIAPDPWRLPSVVAVALVLLQRGGPAPATRELCYYAGRAPGAVSKALCDLRSLGLVDEANHPVLPEPFWQLAARWQPRWHGLEHVPSRHGLDPALRMVLGIEDATLDACGWASVDLDGRPGDGLAVQPGVSGASGPPAFYLPDRRGLGWALVTWGPAELDEAAAHVAVVPTPIAAALRQNPVGAGPSWPRAHPVVFALHLATTTRGRAALETWEPSEPLATGRLWRTEG